MAKQRWSPDTCECAIIQDVIGDVITLDSFEVKGPEHIGVVDDAELYDLIFENENSEQKRKNGMLAAIADGTISDAFVQAVQTRIQIFDEALQQVVTTTGVQEQNELDPDAEYHYIFGDPLSVQLSSVGFSPILRVIAIAVTGVEMTAADLAAIQAYADATYGPGTVEVLDLRGLTNGVAVADSTAVGVTV